jgi:hypothetical protein
MFRVAGECTEEVLKATGLDPEKFKDAMLLSGYPVPGRASTGHRSHAEARSVIACDSWGLRVKLNGSLPL